MEAILLSGGRSSGGWVANSLITCLTALPRFECTANCEQRSEKRRVCVWRGGGRHVNRNILSLVPRLTTYYHVFNKQRSDQGSV